MSQSYNQLGVAPPKRTFLDSRPLSNNALFPPATSVADVAYLSSLTSPTLGGGGVGMASHIPTRPQTSGGNARAGGGLYGTAGMSGGGGGSDVANSYNKMVVSPVPPTHAALSAQGAGPKTTEAVLLVEHKVELTDILHETLSLLDNVYRTKQIFGEHLRYVDPSYSGDAVQKMNLMTPPAFDGTYHQSIGANIRSSSSYLNGGNNNNNGSAFPLGFGGPVGMPSARPSTFDGSIKPDGMAVNSATANSVTTPTGPSSAGDLQQQQQPSSSSPPPTGGAVGSGSNNNNGGGASSQQVEALTSQLDKLKQRLRTAEGFVKKLYNKTSQLDTEVVFYKDELRRMETICGLSRSPATTLSVTDGHIPLNHPLYAPRLRRRCRSAPPTRTLLRTAIGGYGLKFPFATSNTNGGGAQGGMGQGGGDVASTVGGGFTNISRNPFSKKTLARQRSGGGGGRRNQQRRRQSGPFNNASEEDDDEESDEEDSEDENAYGDDGVATAFTIASTDAANAAVQSMRKRILQLTEAVVMLQQENNTLRQEKVNRLSYRDALLTEYLITRDRALAQLRASLQDAVTKVNNPMRLLRARQPNPGTNPAVATNNILQEVYQRLSSEINALVGDIVSGGSAAIVNTNAVLLANATNTNNASNGTAGNGRGGGGGSHGGGGGGNATNAMLMTRDPAEGGGGYEEIPLGDFSPSSRQGGGGLGALVTSSSNINARPASRSVLPAINANGRPSSTIGGGGVLGNNVGSRPGTSGGDGTMAVGGNDLNLMIPQTPVVGGGPAGGGGGRRSVTGLSAYGGGDDADGVGGSYNAMATVAPAGGNNFLFTCHGCGSCVPLATTASSSPSIIIAGGGASVVPQSQLSGLVSDGGADDGNGGDNDYAAAIAGGSLNSAGNATNGGAASIPISCALSQSASKRRELLTRLKPIIDALPLQRRKQLLHIMVELRHLFDCLVLCHRTLLTRYDEDRKESHRNMVQLQVNRSLLRDQIGELEARLAAITATAQRQEHAIQQAARGY